MRSVNDVLQGQTTLLQQSDAGILATNTLGSTVPGQIFPFDSSDSNLTAQGPIALQGDEPDISGSWAGVVSSSASGRLFNNGNDVIVSVSVSSCPGVSVESGWKYFYYNPATGNSQSYCLNRDLKSTGDTEYTNLVMGDFQGDNLVLPLIFVESMYGQAATWQLSIIPAGPQVDVINNDGGALPTSGYSAAGTPHPLYNAIVTGDFNNDGIDEIAVLLSDYQTVRLFKINDPNALTIASYQTITLPQPLLNGTLAAGRFTSNGNIYLAAVGQPANSSSKGSQMTVDFIDPRSQPANVVSTTYSVDGLSSSTFSGAFAQAAPVVNFASSSVQQLVLGLTYTYGSWHTIQIGSFDTSNTFHVQGEESQNGCLFGMKVSNYNNQSPNPNVSGFPDNLNPDLQILELQNEGSGSQCSAPYGNGDLHLQVDNIAVPAVIKSNPQSTNPPAPTNWFTQASDIVPNIGPYSQLTNIQILSGDFQGRSLRLGAPEKMILESHTQPQLVLGMPPMHVDWINPQELTDLCQGPSDSQGSCAANLTAKPNGRSLDVSSAFTSDFSSVNAASSTSKTTSTSSWGVAVKSTLKAKIKFGQAKVATYSIGAKVSAGYAYQNVHSQYDGKYSSNTETLGAATKFDDGLIFTTENQNIFNYPVLGQEDQDGNPLYITYSVPSSVQPIVGGGATQEWYQPLQEPGNVLSYPSSLTMLENENAPGPTDIKTNPVCFLISDDTAFVDATWVNQKSKGTSTGTTNQISGDDKASFSAKVTPSLLTDGQGGQLSFSVDVSGSHGWGSLVDSSTTTSSSNAVEVVQPRFIEASTFGYAYEPIVFGYANAEDPYQSPQDLLPSGLDNTTSGPIYAGFAANPVNQGPGLTCGQPGASWWSRVYTLPDVGFNHPLRWKADSDNDITFRSFDPTQSAFNQQFYDMKGMFITTDTDDTGKPGTPVGGVPDGQPVKLTVRVYNFSLVDTKYGKASSTAQVHVRVYGEQKCGTDFCPNSTFQIPASGRDGDYIIDRIPGFNDPSGAPNWTYATVNFDTTGRAGQNLVFWVVTWIEDQGKVTPEMPDHGMTATSFTGATYSSLSQIPLQAHSNNVGLYDTYSGFQVLPPVESAAQSSASISAESVMPVSSSRIARPHQESAVPLSGIQLSLSSPTVPLDADSILRADLTAGASGFEGSRITYYDGDPGAGGQLIDTQRLPSIAANGTDAQRVFYRPQSCGKRTLYAVTDLEGAPQMVGQTAAEVTLNPLIKVNQMEGYVSSWNLDSSVQASLLAALQSVQDSFTFGSTEAGLQNLKGFQALVQQLVSTNALALRNHESTLLIDADEIQGCQNDLVYSQRDTPLIQFKVAPAVTNVGQTVTLTANVTAPQDNTNVPSGSVQFTGGLGTNSLSLGSATLDSNGNATITTNQLPVGSNTVVASYPGDSNFAPVVKTASVQVNAPGTPAGDFSISSSSDSGVVSRHGALTVTLTIAAQDGFTSPISFSCSGLPADTVCSFSPNPVTPKGANSAITMTISSGVQSDSAAKKSGSVSNIALAFLGFFGLGTLGLRATRLRILACTLFLLSTSMLLISCGDSGPQSPSGVYQVSVTGTSGTLSRSTMFALEVR